MQTHILFKTLIAALFVFIGSVCNAQLDIKGTITNNKDPLIGASIMIKGSTCSQLADESGKFHMKCDDVLKDVLLVVSAAGFKSAEIDLGTGPDLELSDLRINYISREQFTVSK